MKTILVTGGAGFIGSEFARQAVRKGHAVMVLDSLTYAGDRKRLEETAGRLEFIEADICSTGLEDIFKEKRIDYIAHFAAESHVDRSILDPSVFIETNVKGTSQLLNMARKFGVERFLYVSTDEVYGDLPEEGQFIETTPFNPSSPYSASKAAADLLVKSYHRTYGMSVVTARPSNNYGPWQYPEKLIPVIIYKALRNERIPVYGKGLNVREWLYVEDCAAGVFEILQRGRPGQEYNIGSGQERRNIDVVKGVIKIMGKPEGLIEFIKDRPGHDFRYSLNADKIKNELGWRAVTGFEDGLERTVRWYLDNMVWVEEKMGYLKDYWEKVYGGVTI
ncbi:dTDP-glucose 4,6-dehydratase 2 [Gammaproteobacteria bacterium]